jgi:L-lactate dehydrogenase
MKISVIGVGRVGSTVAYSAVVKGLVDEIVLVDRAREIAEGEAHDLLHAASFTAHPVDVRAGGYPETAGSDVVVICASVPWQPEFSSRLDLAVGNAKLYREIIPEIAAASPDAVLLVVTNPVDVLTYHALRISGFPPSRVIGTGTLVDSARFRALLSQEVGIHPDDLRAYILGEHGDSGFPALSVALTGGKRIDAESDRGREIFRTALQAGHFVFERKGYTNFAIAMAAATVIEAVARDSRRTMPVSVLVEGYLGVEDVSLSLPCVIGRQGIIRQLHPDLCEEEAAAFRRSAGIVREAIEASSVSA